MNYAQTHDLTGLTPERLPTRQDPVRPIPSKQLTGREFREEHVIQKLVLIVVMLVVIGQLVWAMG